ncbi:16S rRNA (guanine(527)-N(7))-methyltransferase RsmG [Membranihabitans maritimus]|uniref:16S rRNA (guanine(527)-N(7))-methyltransferase RsmG n=1 Tax=Membranihabitans maritimus TaxID=2904244 RepID=UPI001F007A39|nr:16S rRNA (guanine(527)-N(7))-methyltransferase RsmG [Membranihabitans maritimus]
MDVIEKYYSEKSLKRFSDDQMEKIKRLEVLYKEWNNKINVISRKDIDQIYLHHVIHSLSISEFTTFSKGTKILDLGTGGGFPGIPLAIRFPDSYFHLIDGTKKKIKVVNEIANELGLDNVLATQVRAEELKGKYDFVVSRAVASLQKLVNWSGPLISREGVNPIPNGLLALKGGDLKQEIAELAQGTYCEVTPITKYFNEEYFSEKKLIYVQL